MRKLRTGRVIIILAFIGAGIFLISKTGKEENTSDINENQFSEDEIKQIFKSATEEIPYDTTEEKENKEEEKGNQYAAWIPYWDMDNAKNSISANSDFFHSLSPTWYYVQADGGLAQKHTARDGELIHLCNEYSIMLIPSISNSNPDELSEILNDNTLREQHIDNIIREVLNFNYDGIDIDYEHIKSDDKEKFSEFISLLGQELHSESKKLTIAILWKDELAPIIGRFSESRAAQDWGTLSSSVDEFRIMAYDYTGSADSPGAIAPKDWISSILTYARENVPDDKIVLGLPLYAYDWVENTKGAKALVWADVNGIKKDKGLQVISDLFDTDTYEKKLKYKIGTTTRVIWYQDREATEKRVELANTYNVKSFVFWRLGGEDPGLYKLK